MRIIYKLLIALIGAIASIALPTACAYGTESVVLDLSGRAIDEQKQPIGNLKVTLQVLDEPQEQKRTDSNGEFKFNREIELYADPAAEVLIEDDDGDNNGGDFLSKTTAVPADLIQENQPIDLEIEMSLKSQ